MLPVSWAARAPADDVVGLQDLVEPLAVIDVELHRALLHDESQQLGASPELRYRSLRLGDLRLELGLLRLRVSDPFGQDVRLLLSSLELFLRQRQRIAFRVVVGGHDPARRDGGRRRRERDESNESHDGLGASLLHLVRFCRGTACPRFIDRGARQA